MDSRGTVTPISSLFPAEEAMKASQRMQETIEERQMQLGKLKGFIDDNVSLINLVGRLPDETHHHIMVPFGKAAFFPGRLVHTNEFMVLLGEGYYAERSAKQAIEILKRREKVLESQVQSVEAIIRDLKAEATFFYATAIESSEGLVEIREDYEGGSSQVSVAAAAEMNDINTSNEDEEYERIFARMSELEKEEEEDEAIGSIEFARCDLESSSTKLSTDQRFASSLVEKAAKSEENAAVDIHTTSKPLKPQIEKKQPQDPVPRNTQAAFTGSVVEHDYNLNHSPEVPSASKSSSTRPVSRFKMQRKK